MFFIPQTSADESKNKYTSAKHSLKEYEKPTFIVPRIE